MNFYGLKEPTDDYMELVILIAKNEKRFIEQRGFDGKMKKVYDIDAVSRMLLKNFFDGKLGQIFLDNDHLFENHVEEIKGINKFV